MELDSVHGKCAPSYATVANWVAEFKFNPSSVKDPPCSGTPKRANLTKLLEKSEKS